LDWAKREKKERERGFEGGFRTYMFLKTSQQQIKQMQTKNDAQSLVVANII
jgi:hypothetical protein